MYLPCDMFHICRKVQACVGMVVKNYGISIAEVPFFIALSERDGATQEELTSLVGVDKALTARTVQSLERKGFVRKEHDVQDRRVNHIYKTQKAEEHLGAIFADLHKLTLIFTAGLEKSDMEHLTQTLSVIESNISNHLARQR